MREAEIQSFWNAHPCGDHVVGGLHEGFADDHDRFFTAYDTWRYAQESHIPRCLDRTTWSDQAVLEIGLGEGAESEQLINRGARWSGLDLTDESVARVRARLRVRGLPYEDLRRGSVLEIPWPDDTFDIVFSHGVLHHVPDIHRAQTEIHRVLKPGGTLVAMVYARHSLNYQVSIRVARRTILAAAFPLRRMRVLARSEMLRRHLDNAENMGLRRYLDIDTFTHFNTDGPLNPFARVYSPRQVRQDFPDFELVSHSKQYMHAPPLPVGKMRFLSRYLGWHLWVWLEARPGPSTPTPSRIRLGGSAGRGELSDTSIEGSQRRSGRRDERAT